MKDPVDPDTCPEAETFPVTPRVDPSKVRFDSTVALGAEPFRVMTPLSVVPVNESNPDVPAEPLDPDDPADPEEPLVPADPEVPEVPDVPADPDVPDVPVDPDVPDVPADPERPLVPAEPLAPIMVSLRTLNDPVSPALFITR